MYLEQNVLYLNIHTLQNNTKYTKQSDKELNTLMNDNIFVSPRDYFKIYIINLMKVLSLKAEIDIAS